MSDGRILKELKDLEASGDLPQHVTNRTVLAGIIMVTEKLENGRYDKRISILEKVVTILTTLVLATLGWVAFAQ